MAFRDLVNDTSEAKFLAKMVSYGLGAEGKIILDHIEEKYGMCLDEIYPLELWQLAAGLFSSRKISYNEDGPTEIANKVCKAAGKETDLRLKPAVKKRTDWQTAFCCNMHEKYRRMGNAEKTLDYFLKKGIGESELLAMDEKQIIALVDKIPSHELRGYFDGTARKQIVLSIEYANVEERKRLKMEPIEYPLQEIKPKLNLNDIGSERHNRRRSLPDAQPQFSRKFDDFSFVGEMRIADGTLLTLELVRKRDEAIKRRQAWEKAKHKSNNGRKMRY